MKAIRSALVRLKLRKTEARLRKSRQAIDELGGPVLEYERLIAPKRKELGEQIDQLYQGLTCRKLHLFLIFYSSIGAKMVAKASDWTARWGRWMTERGQTELGAAMTEHASEEVGHDQWHTNDVRTLTLLYERRYGETLNLKRIMSLGSVPCVARYTDLNEGLAIAAEPGRCYGLLSETENLAYFAAPRFIGHCATELGFEIMKGMTFIRGHFASDVHHIRENIEQMHTYLTRNPESLGAMVAAGEATIDVYINYLHTAMELARLFDNKASVRTRIQRVSQITPA